MGKKALILGDLVETHPDVEELKSFKSDGMIIRVFKYPNYDNIEYIFIVVRWSYVKFRWWEKAETKIYLKESNALKTYEEWVREV